jgi:hypothetical protein
MARTDRLDRAAKEAILGGNLRRLLRLGAPARVS